MKHHQRLVAVTRLNRPLWPLLVVVLSPSGTLPITAGIVLFLPEYGNDLPVWQVGHIRLALLPGLVDLVTFVWRLSAKSRVKLRPPSLG